MSRPPSVSVIVPVRNREEEIKKCLESLLNLDYPDCEIIVVDNMSEDNTKGIAAQFPVKLISEERINQYAARNAGIREARGEIVAFTDSDCVADRSCLKNLVRLYDRQQAGGVGGRLTSFSPQNAVERFLSFGDLDFQTPEGDIIQKRSERLMSGLVGSANVSYRRDVLLKTGGFDEDYDCCGDYDLCRKVQDLGYTMMYERMAVVRHKHRSSIREMFRQFFRYGQGLPLFYKKRHNGLSYIKLKAYLLPPLYRSFRSPRFHFHIDIDFANIAILLLAASLFYPGAFNIGLVLLSFVIAGAFIKSIPVAKKTKKLRWFILFPLFHALRNAAFSLGKIAGAVRYRVIFI